VRIGTILRVRMMGIGLVRGASMRLGGLLVIGMEGIRLGIRGEVRWDEMRCFPISCSYFLLITETCI
jgi:hypothetical protein